MRIRIFTTGVIGNLGVRPREDRRPARAFPKNSPGGRAAAGTVRNQNSDLCVSPSSRSRFEDAAIHGEFHRAGEQDARAFAGKSAGRISGYAKQKAVRAISFPVPRRHCQARTGYAPTPTLRKRRSRARHGVLQNHALTAPSSATQHFAAFCTKRKGNSSSRWESFRHTNFLNNLFAPSPFP